MNSYIIRPMKQGDAKSLAELDRKCFSMPWSEHSFNEEAANEMAHYLVCEVDNVIVGYIGFWQVIDEGHITNIAVAPDFRRKGIASDMLTRTIRTAQERGLVLLTLEVRKGNAPACALYEGFGFRELGERRDYYQNPRENAVIMTLPL